MSINIQTWYNFALQQMASESYLNQIGLNGIDLKKALMFGNNNPSYQQNGELPTPTAPILNGNTRMTEQQATDFLNRYEIVHHQPNTASGFSATLIREIATGKFTLSFRSTEYADQSQGGDWERDGISGADSEVHTKGFAFGQLLDMEQYWDTVVKPLVGFATVNVTGYSLGGNLATAFTQLHLDAVASTTTINPAGIGQIAFGSQPNMTQTQLLRELLTAFRAKLLALDPNWDTFAINGNNNIYSNGTYRNAFNSLLNRSQNNPDQVTAYLTTYFTEILGNGAITQLYGHGAHNDTELVSNSGSHVKPTMIFIEDQPNIEGLGPLTWFDSPDGLRSDYGTTHSITLLADSLAVMSVFEKLGLDMGVDTGLLTAYNLLAASGNKLATGLILTNGKAESDSLENSVEALAKLLLGQARFEELAGSSQIPRGTAGGTFGNLDNRTSFYKVLDGINSALLNQSYVIESLVGVNASTLLQLALDTSNVGRAMAFRYALASGNSFVVTGFDYTTKNQAGELDLSSVGNGQLTEDYLKDRAAFVERVIFYNLHDADYTTSANGASVPGYNLAEPLNNSNTEADRYDSENILWDDRTLDIPIQRVSVASADTQRIIFGSSNSESDIDGGESSDHLYGGAGIDVLTGNAGADYLEGNTGADKLNGGTGDDHYVINRGDGNDTIIDSDGSGKITLAGHVVTGGEYVSPNLWRKDSVSYTFTPDANGRGRLIITSEVGLTTVQDFGDGDLGITLAGAPTPTANPTTTRTITGDLVLLDTDEATAGDQLEYDDLGNPIQLSGQAAPGFADALFDSPGNDRITSFGGNDQVDASAGGDDWLQLGDGNDFAAGRNGNDLVEGEAGADFVAGDAGDDRVYADSSIALDVAIANGETDTANNASSGAQWADGGAGADVVIASATADVVMGGGGSDVLVGGAGDDILHGDAGRTFVNVGWTVTRETVTTGNTTSYTERFTNANYVVATDGAADALYGGAGSDWLYGETGDDLLNAGSGADVAFGGDDNDTILGRAGADALNGEAGDDFADGGDDDDKVSGGAGADALYGGAGNDVLTGDALGLAAEAQGADYLDGEEGDDVLIGGGGADELFGGAGNDQLFGESVDTPLAAQGDDYLDGEEGDDVLVGGGGADVLFGGAGNDELFGEASDTPMAANGDDYLDGEGGNDTLVGAGGSDTLIGGAGADVLHGDGTDLAAQYHGADVIEGGDDNDFLFGGGGADRLSGDAGADQISGDAGDDIAAGGAGNDLVDGGDGNDVLTGDAGSDQLQGGIGNDLLDGGADNDTLIGQAGNDTLLGQSGADLIDGGDGADLLDGGDGNDQLQGGVGNDTLLGQGGADLIDGGDGADLLDGGADNDQLQAGAGNDTLIGGDGNDVMVGQGGNDYLEGGAGNDTMQGDDGGAPLVGGNDTLLGGAGDDYLDAGAGSDVVDGGDGNDTLFSGTGADTLTGGAGDDVIVLNGAGVKRISDEGGTDAVRIVGVDFQDVVLRLGSLVIDTGIAGNEIHIDDFNPDDPLASGSIESFEFDDGTFSYAQLLAKGIVIDGTAGAGAGNDAVYRRRA